jgi:hypothetical protein
MIYFLPSEAFAKLMMNETPTIEANKANDALVRKEMSRREAAFTKSLAKASSYISDPKNRNFVFANGHRRFLVLQKIAPTCSGGLFFYL